MKDEQKIRAAAIKEARLRLLPINVHSWNEPAVSRQREHQAAIRALKAILSEARLALSKTQGLWWMLDFDIESSLSSIEHVLKTHHPGARTDATGRRKRARARPASKIIARPNNCGDSDSDPPAIQAFNTRGYLLGYCGGASQEWK
jgi:hypothetical protein